MENEVLKSCESFEIGTYVNMQKINHNKPLILVIANKL
jgi:hypothetical protein